jgi:arylsulfatase A-like enzyme
MLLVAAGACSPRPDVQGVVLVTIDTWRADRFGAGGDPRVRTPHLDRFFRGATQFADAWSAAPTTLASHATMLTAQWPTEHAIPRNGWPLPSGVPTLAEALQRAGVATAAFVSSAALDPAFGLSRGFDVYDAEATRAVAGDQAWRPAAETLPLAEAWWAKAPRRRFLWVHVFEPHFPYEPQPPDFALYDTGYRGPANGSMPYLYSIWNDPQPLPADARDHLESLYVAEITGVDRALGTFLERIASAKGVLAIVTADHGESLGEHGVRFLHGPDVYPGDVRVPLALRGGSVFPPGRVTSATVRTIDLAPTILARLGLRASLGSEGGDLAECLAGPGRRAFSEASMPWGAEREGSYPNQYKQRAVRTQEWTFLETPWRGDTPEWYRRAEDPGESGPPGAAPPSPAAAGLPELLREWIGRGRPRPPPSIDPELAERLRSLGYVDDARGSP